MRQKITHDHVRTKTDEYCLTCGNIDNVMPFIQWLRFCAGTYKAKVNGGHYYDEANRTHYYYIDPKPPC